MYKKCTGTTLTIMLPKSYVFFPFFSFLFMKVDWYVPENKNICTAEKNIELAVSLSGQFSCDQLDLFYVDKNKGAACPSVKSCQVSSLKISKLEA